MPLSASDYPPHQARTWLALEYNLTAADAATVYDSYAAIAQPRPAAGAESGASAPYVAAEWVRLITSDYV